MAALPYTDVIVAFLVPPTRAASRWASVRRTTRACSPQASGAARCRQAGSDLLGWGLVSHRGLRALRQGRQRPSRSIVGNWVAKYRFDGVDIDYEDSEAFYDPTTAGYSGRTFLIDLTRGLASQLPPNQ